MRHFTGLLIGLLSAAAVYGQAPSTDSVGEKFHVFSGTYMKALGGKSEGIYRHDFDAATGRLGEATVATTDVGEPSFLALHPNGRVLYAAGETSKGRAGIYAIQTDGGLKTLQTGNLVRGCHLAVDASGKYLAMSGERGFTVYQLADDGTVSSEIQKVTHDWPATGRNAPFVHGLYFDAKSKHVIAVDMGCEKVVAYSLANDGVHRVEPYYSTDQEKAGPRHLAFHPDGRYVYVLNELSGYVNVLGYDVVSGALHNLSKVKAYSQETDRPWAAEIQVHPNRRFVYASQRGLRNISLLYVSEDGARLQYVAESEKIGAARHFTIDPTGKWLLAGAGGQIHVFAIDQETGKLTKQTSVKSPSVQCVLFAPVSER